MTSRHKSASANRQDDGAGLKAGIINSVSGKRTAALLAAMHLRTSRCCKIREPRGLKAIAFGGSDALEVGGLRAWQPFGLDKTDCVFAWRFAEFASGLGPALRLRVKILVLSGSSSSSIS